MKQSQAPTLKLSYDHKAIESKWQADWEQRRLYQPDLSSAKEPLHAGGQAYYNLHMFPYPSAEGLHVGNVYAFTGADIHGRFKRMQGFDVFQPFGLDGFGIHSENYALKIGSHPMDQAQASEKRFYEQVHALGSGYDWSHTLETYDPDYYRWTQWLFIELFKSGLAYREKVAVNFCPSCKTVLADEQVIDTKCERCGAVVEKKDLEQWMFRITEYADQLLEGLDRIDWTEKVKTAQRNWIGKSEGAKIDFPLVISKERQSTERSLSDPKISHSVQNDSISVFTTRPDTLYGATFMVVSPEHPFVAELLSGKWQMGNGELEEIKEYVEKSIAKIDADRIENDKEKTGLPGEARTKEGIFSGAYALNPINNQQIPIWIADYVLMSYGTGAIMAVPAHDERDFAFAKKYNLPIIQVIAGETGKAVEGEERRDGGCGVIFNPETQKYAVASYPDGLLRLYAGGVDDQEDMVKGILREISEESGLYDFSHIETIKTTFTHYYNRRKKVHRSALATCILAICRSIDVKETHHEEHEIGFKLEWLTPKEILANWTERNKDQGLDHWIEFLIESVGRAIDLGLDTTSDPDLYKVAPYSGSGMLINSGRWNGLRVPEAKREVLKQLVESGAGVSYTNYHLRDWLISRQRYWGPPIPMIYCQACSDAGKSWFDTDNARKREVSGMKYHGEIRNSKSMKGWYPEESLPVLLPRINDYKPSAEQNSQKEGVSSPLGNHPEFYEAECPGCGAAARRETDVSDTFLDSSWYFLRYLSTDLQKIPFPMGEPKAKEFGAEQSEVKEAVMRQNYLPVAMYTGGAEHAVLHLLYTRFFYKVLFDLGYVDQSGGDEPFPRFFAHGLIIKDGSKMSKSKGNVIVPDAYIEKFGADTLRAYLMFLGPFNQGGDFRDSGIEGMNRFIKRIWTMITGQTIFGNEMSTSAKSAMNEAIRGVTEDIESFKYNTAIAKIMTYYNGLAKQESVTSNEAKVLLQLLAPFAPHMTEELWQKLEFPVVTSQFSQNGSASQELIEDQKPIRQLADENWSIHTSVWPEFDAAAIQQAGVVIAVQVNGKLRGALRFESGQVITEEEVSSLAKEDSGVQKHLEGKTIRKVIYVPGKILNFVVS